ncbi:hypothetical protein KL905_001513 [Ogataea polymorpha]|uniref:Uncharacterized protein n=1 Tax=Ogataea polymorpha TaxID=460523 RepID=A0A1B7SM67_9ASCO|nr:uncharacterized protein OGAPODRAFT_92790 [Ogataea polymorpha]KAG7880020.1 hypothetical protein KL937_002904 [Ogataea polymorpha]KAG7897106.1 hypothetical protein KL908_000508 [Ogataea polymorpha]KAG7912306.1 hypothetical protein KL906_000510 [Ogataea polymorpha]KAG7923247.1 hypothetical protein KL905_001513 [Ogataea polymorpha]KAG7929103.1 hypothetical protein KL925_001284 [Ogataea polymorpha]
MPITTKLPNDMPWESKAALPQVTLRSTIAGLVIGSVILVSNFQFGLQTGWVSMMSLPSALLGFSIFKTLQPRLHCYFTDVENVFVQSVAVAVATGPLAYGFIGIIPAIEKLMTDAESGSGSGIDLSQLWKLVTWAFGLAFFGVFFAVPLRKQFIIKEKLAFPSGSATATLISVFHGTTLNVESQMKSQPKQSSSAGEHENHPERPPTPNNITIIESQDLCQLQQVETYQTNIKLLAATSSVSSIYTVVGYFVPQIKRIPILGKTISESYLINFQASPSYIGQGMIMGFTTTAYMMVGMVFGWCILSPLAQYMGWAPGPVDDWKEGAEGWIMWISLSIMISDSIISFLVIVAKSLASLYQSPSSRPLSRAGSVDSPHEELERLIDENEVASDEDISSSTYHDEASNDHTPKNSCSLLPETDQFSDRSTYVDLDESHQVSATVTIVGLIVSSVACVVCTRLVFGPVVPIYTIVTAIILSLFLSVLGVRALGETDLNPVSGIGKLSQLIFALIIPKSQPGAILINLISGAISEAATQQAGDLLQDLKTGYLLGASPKAQFIAQIYGSLFSVLLSAVMYKLYNSIYKIPSQMFKIPTAVIWIDCARLVNGSGLPPKVFEFAIVLGIVFAIISFVKNTVTPENKWHKYIKFLPSGVPVGIGIYNVPSFTLARFVGGLVSYFWLRKVTPGNSDARVRLIIFSSGLVLGEGLFSVLNMLLTSLNVPHL